MFAYIIGILSGAALPVQTSVNTRLSHRLGAPFLSTLVSFSGGAVFTALILLLRREALFAPVSVVRGEPLWMWSGGLFGIILVTLNLLLLPQIGSVQTVIFGVLGQILTGLLIDHFGWFHSAEIHISLYRVIGALLVILGTVMVSWERGSEAMHAIKSSSSLIWLCRFGGIVSGAAVGIQVAVNGYLGEVVQSTFKATLVSFLSGAILAAVVCLAVRLIKGTLIENPDRSIGNHWWLWTGGVFGVTCVGANVILAHAFGTGMTVIITLIGQIAGGIVIDRIGFLGAERKLMTSQKGIGLIVMVAGAAMIQLL